MWRGIDRGRIYVAPDEVHPADWEAFGKKAGVLRNVKMAALGADLCIAFLHPTAANRGTRHMIDVAEKHGIPVEIHGGP